MFVGHGLLAFAVVASVGRRLGWEPERALWVGAIAGGFATLPDVDMLYALSGLASAIGGPAAVPDAFWGAANEFHRAITHALPVAALAAAGFAAAVPVCTARGVRENPARTALATVFLGGLLAAVLATSGSVAAVLSVPFVAGGLALVALAARKGFDPRTVLLAAGFGLASHPFGDLFTGAPPALLYPFDLQLLAARVTLHADPTLHLLGAFFVELATIWLAVAVYARLSGRSLRRAVRFQAGIGVGYAGAVLVVPAPTLDVASPFVFSVLAVGAVVPFLRRRQWNWWSGAVTALATVTLAALAYTGAYLVG